MDLTRYEAHMLTVSLQRSICTYLNRCDSPLLRILPAELRNQVYEYAVVSHKPIEVTYLADRLPVGRQQRSFLDVALRHTCR